MKASAQQANAPTRLMRSPRSGRPMAIHAERGGGGGRERGEEVK